MADENHLSSGELKILEERARLLAHVPQADDSGEYIEVVVVALAGESYGIPIDSVVEIQPLSTLTPLPGVPAYWVGLLNLRSRLLPLLDLRAYLGLPPFPWRESDQRKENGPQKANGKTQRKGEPILDGEIILVSQNGNQIGLLVDRVSEVQKLPREKIGPPLTRPAASEHKVTEGLTPDLLTLLDLNELLKDPGLIVQNAGGS